MVKNKSLIRAKKAGPHKDFRYTTPEALKRERNILDLEQSGRDKSQAPVQKQETHTYLNNRGLNQGQKQACELILTSKNQIVGVQGLAGTGKTFMLSSAREIADQQGFQMIGVAPSASAANELAKTGMPAHTIASFQASQNKKLSPKTILVIDEAGMASSKQIESLLKSAAQYESRVVLVGDTQQLKAVEAGRPFAQLQEHGMTTAGMSEIQRQKNPELKKAVELAASEQVIQSIALLDKQILEVSENEARYDQIAQDYVSLPKKERENTLVVSGTNEARKEINQRIRKGLGLNGQGKEIKVLVRKDFTKAELKRIENYQIGDFIKPERSYQKPGLQKQELYRVAERKKSKLIIENSGGSRIHWNPAKQAKVNVYMLENCEIAKGEILRVTKNHRENGLINGERVQFDKSEGGKLQFTKENGKLLTLSASKPLHLEYGYCSTVHAAQGKTSERVFIEANTRSLTSAQDNFYVAISRAKQEAKIYTNDKNKLPEAMSRKNEKSTALELDSRS